MLGLTLINKLGNAIPTKNINNIKGRGRLLHFIISTDYDWNIEIPETAFDNFSNGDLVYLSLGDSTQNLYEPKVVKHSKISTESLKRISENTKVTAKKYTSSDLTQGQVNAIRNILNHSGHIDDISIVLSRTDVIDQNKPFDYLLSAMGYYMDVSKLQDHELPEVFQDIFIYHRGNLYSLKQGWVDNVIRANDIIDYISELTECDRMSDPIDEMESSTASILDDIVDGLLNKPAIQVINNSEVEVAKRKLAILRRAIPDSEFKKIRISGPDSDYINYDVEQQSIWVSYTHKPCGNQVEVELPEDLKEFLEINIVISNLRDLVPTIRDQLELSSKIKPLPEELYQKYSTHSKDAIECFVMVKFER